MEGGSANDYDYCSGDPVNCNDLSGRDEDVFAELHPPFYATQVGYVPVRSGRHRGTPSRYVDGYGNFGWVHARRHINADEFPTRNQWEHDVALTLSKPDRVRGETPSSSSRYVFVFKKHIDSDDSCDCGLGYGANTGSRTVTVVVDVGEFSGSGIIGLKTAYVNYDDPFN